MVLDKTFRQWGIGGLLMLAGLLVGCATRDLQTTAELSPQRRAAIEDYLQAKEQLRKGDQQAAVAALQEAIRQDSKMVMAHSLLGDIYKNDHDYSKAASQYEVLVDLDPDTADNHAKLGLMYFLLHRLESAAKSFLKAVKIDPKNFDAHMNLAAVYLALDEPAEALQYAQRATEINSASAAAWCNLAICYDSLPVGPVKTNQFQHAEQAYRRSLELNSEQVQTELYLAQNLMRQQKPAEARSVVRAVLQAENSALTHKLLGDTWFLERKFDEAVKEYDAALKLDPHYFKALNEKGWVLMTQYQDSMELDENKRAMAMQTWQQSLRLNPEQPRIVQLVKQYTQKQLFQP